MLKRCLFAESEIALQSAAFGRLRVETSSIVDKPKFTRSAAFGRLRVETSGIERDGYGRAISAAFGRLRVETFV